MSELENFKKRIEWLDVAKTIAILGTIGSHTFAGRPLLHCVSYTLFVIFWLTSGYTIRPCNGMRGLINCTLKDIKRMIIPSFFICIFSAVLATLVGEYCNWETLVNNIKNHALFFVSSNPGMLWFFWALLWAKLLYRIFLKMGYFRYIPMVILVVLAMIYSPEHRLIMMLDVTPVGVLLLEFGHLLKCADVKMKALSVKKQYLIEVLITAIAVAGSFYLTWEKRLYIDLSGRDYTVLAILQCVCLMIFVLVICKELCKTPLVQPLSEIGQHTFGILLLHFLDGYWISPITDRLFELVGFSNDFIYFGIRVALLIIVTQICVKIQERFYYFINHGKH